jgi:hypothetical protein
VTNWGTRQRFGTAERGALGATPAEIATGKKDPWITPLCVPSGPGRQPRGLRPS